MEFAVCQSQGGEQCQDNICRSTVRERNNLGVASFQQGMLQEAFNCFHTALQDAKATLRSRGNTCQDTENLRQPHGPTDMNGNQSEYSKSDHSQAVSVSSYSHTPTDWNKLFQNGVFLCLDGQSRDHTFVFLETAERHDMDECASRSIFNLATLYYWKACNVPGRTADATSALKLYQLSYQMQATVENPENDDLAYTLMLATVNAMGEVNILLGDMQRSCECFEHMLRTIVLCIQDQSTTPLEACCKDLRDRLLERATRSCLSGRVSAPAA